MTYCVYMAEHTFLIGAEACNGERKGQKQMEVEKKKIGKKMTKN